MRAVTLFAASFVLAGLASAQAPTTRIEVGNENRAVVVLTGEDSAGQFTAWGGPGNTTGSDFADWAAGPVEAPQGFAIYSVRFYCAADAAGHEAIPSNQCHGFHYAVAPGQPGYIQIAEGTWFHATERWDQTVQPRLAAALDTTRNDDSGRYHRQQPRVYRQSSPSTRATGAKPTLKPKN